MSWNDSSTKEIGLDYGALTAEERQELVETIERNLLKMQRPEAGSQDKQVALGEVQLLEKLIMVRNSGERSSEQKEVHVLRKENKLLKSDLKKAKRRIEQLERHALAMPVPSEGMGGS